MPTATDQDNVLFTTDAKWYDSPLISSYPHPKRGVLNTGIRVGVEVNGSIPYATVAAAKTAMATMATAFFDAGGDKPQTTLNVSYVDLGRTDEYAEYAALFSVGLGDDVTVYYPPLNIDLNMRVITMQWDAVLDQPYAATLGNFAPNIAQTVVANDIDISALKTNVASKLTEGEDYNGVYINHTDGVMTTAEVGGKIITVKHNSTEGISVYADDEYIGGVAVVNGKVAFVGNVLTNDVNGDCYAVIGDAEISSDIYKGIFLYDKRESESDPILRIISKYGYVLVKDVNGTSRIQFGDSSSIDMIIRDRNNVSRFSCSDSLTEITVAGGSAALQADSNSILIMAPGTNNRLGADSTGPFYVKAGVKHYF